MVQNTQEYLLTDVWRKKKARNMTEVSGNSHLFNLRVTWKSRLTLTRVKKPPHIQRGTAPSGWRCGLELPGNAHAWLSQTPSWWCWHQPACCSALHLPCPGCCLHAGPGATRAPSTTAGPADPSHPESERRDLSSSKQAVNLENHSL